MSESSTLIGYEGRTIPREALALVPTPPGTETRFGLAGCGMTVRFQAQQLSEADEFYPGLQRRGQGDARAGDVLKMTDQN
jgi:hypothetical protein